MKSVTGNSLKSAFLSIAMVGLVSCGGGGGDSDDNSGDNSIPADFDLFEQSGTWRLIADSEFNLISDITVNTDTVNLVSSAEAKQTVVTSFESTNGVLTTQSCDADAAEVEVIDDIDIEADFNDPSNPFSCVSTSLIFTEVSATNYTIEYSCDNTLAFKLDFTKLSDQTEFDFGNLSFTSTLHADLNTTVGVCGSREEGQGMEVYTPQPNALNLLDETTPIHSFNVAAPYDGNRISIDFEFSEAIQTGVYTVVDGIVATGEVSVFLSSLIYGGTVDDPNSVDGNGGTVTIAAISDFSIAGSFDITTDDGDTINGSFSFDIS